MINNDLNTKRLLVKSILENALHYNWSLQGLGMLRLYLSPEVRMHVWHRDFEVPGVSKIHTHPWHLESEIIVGEIYNMRYQEPRKKLPGLKIYNRALLKCGTGGCIMSEPEKIELFCRRLSEHYRTGSVYNQKATEIHESDYIDGTVTIVTRTFLEDRDHAYIFWEDGAKWVSAEPRPATEKEIVTITRCALDNWF